MNAELIYVLKPRRCVYFLDWSSDFYDAEEDIIAEFNQ